MKNVKNVMNVFVLLSAVLMTTGAMAITKATSHRQTVKEVELVTEAVRLEHSQKIRNELAKVVEHKLRQIKKAGYNDSKLKKEFEAAYFSKPMRTKKLASVHSRSNRFAVRRTQIV